MLLYHLRCWPNIEPQLVIFVCLTNTICIKCCSNIIKRGALSSTWQSLTVVLIFLFPVFQDELLLLVTDQGFLTESNVVWETLSNVEGDGHFVDTEFRTYRKAEASTTPIPPPAVSPGSASQVDQE